MQNKWGPKLINLRACCWSSRRHKSLTLPTYSHRWRVLRNTTLHSKTRSQWLRKVSANSQTWWLMNLNRSNPLWMMTSCDSAMTTKSKPIKERPSNHWSIPRWTNWTPTRHTSKKQWKDSKTSLLTSTLSNKLTSRRSYRSTPWSPIKDWQPQEHSKISARSNRDSIVWIRTRWTH